MHHKLATASACLALTAVLSAGCSGGPAPSGQSGFAVVPAGDARPQPQGDASAVTALAPSEKRSAITSNFPAEVPAPQGRYLRANAQGSDAWDYEVEVQARAADVQSFYMEAYVGRGWFVAREGQFDSADGGGTFVELRKGNAESSVSILRVSDTVTRVRVTLGVGAPVLQTQ